MMFWPMKTVDVSLDEIASVQLGGGYTGSDIYSKPYPEIFLSSGRRVRFAAFQESASKKAVAAMQAFLQRSERAAIGNGLAIATLTLGLESKDPMPPLVLVLIGVSGSGKTTIGKLVAERLGAAFADADDFHSPSNKAKMHAAIPLDDADRQSWLAAIAAQIERWRAEGQPGLITCSALKLRYRDTIGRGRPDVRLVYLKGEKSLIAHRLAGRRCHFMPVSLLDSQFETLEEPAPDEQILTVGIDKTPAAIADEIVTAISNL